VCPKNSRLGSDGICYENCAEGWSPIDNGPMCAKNCPLGFAQSASITSSSLSCIRPTFEREVKPHLSCPAGADRQFDVCLLDCPLGTRKKFALCVPDCPIGFIESSDGLSCQAEFTKRKAIMREACYENETRVGGRFCLSPCPLGYAASKENEELCYALMPEGVQQFFWSGDSTVVAKGQTGPVISKILFSRSLTPAVCETDYDAYASQCYAECPDNSLSLGAQCVADCPEYFKSNANQTACIRPTVKSKPIKSFIQKIVDGILAALSIFIGFVLLVILVTRFA
jgi:hypothetical protein